MLGLRRVVGENLAAEEVPGKAAVAATLLTPASSLLFLAIAAVVMVEVRQRIHKICVTSSESGAIRSYDAYSVYA